MVDYIVGGIVALVFIAVVTSIIIRKIKMKKAGITGCCGSCGSCSGNCKK